MSRALKRLTREYKDITKEGNYLFSINFDEDNILKWFVTIIGPPDTFYENGLFNLEINFTEEYPFRAPTVRFTSSILHPNIYEDGGVCISILHEGVDNYGYEDSGERWMPSQNVTSILLSIISMLNEPNFESPANIDASVMWKDNPDEFKRRVYEIVANSLN